MGIRTHRGANPSLVGMPTMIVDDQEARVELVASTEMTVDEKGLVHGGFTFGLADYAAMLAVNHPNVVLGKAECKFIAPVKVGDRLSAKALVDQVNGKRRVVEVRILSNGNSVFEGVFYCYVLDSHVLEK